MKYINNNRFTFLQSAPLALLGLLLLSFGSLFPWLGYGFDEWHFVYYSTRGAEGLRELFHYDGHPQATWSFIQSFNLLGYDPLTWHVYSLFWRWLAVVSFWLCLMRVWAGNHRQNFIIAALFAIHPVFTLQVFPISYFEIWIGYTLLFLSFFFTILAIQKPEKYHLFTTVAVALAVGHVFTREYAWFVELMRPVLIWFVLPSKVDWRNKVIQSIKIWMPYFIVFAAAMFWRGFLYTPLRKSFQVRDSLFTNPGMTLLVWLLDFLPDAGIVLITSWFKTFNSETVYFFRPFNLFLFVLILFVTFTGGWYIRKMDASSTSSEHWANQAILLGLPSIFFGILPFYIASYSIHLTETPHNSRFAIGMLPGAALITAALLEKMISKPNLRIWLSVLLLGLGVGWHVRYANDFRKVWVYQSNFLEQLTWRVPGMEQNTAIYVWQPSYPEIDRSVAGLSLYTEFSVSMAVNSIYQVEPVPTENSLSYWYYALSTDTVDIPQASPLHAEHATTYFEGNTTDALFFYYDPGGDRCLRLINTEDGYYKPYPDAVKEMAVFAAEERVSSTVKQNMDVRHDIFGDGRLTWCYFYQKADLARQYKQWREVPLLWQQAIDNQLYASFGTEYLPFIEGFARLGKWQTAAELSLSANKISKAMDSILCPLWNDLEGSTLPSEERDAAVKQVETKLKCVDP